MRTKPLYKTLLSPNEKLACSVLGATITHESLTKPMTKKADTGLLGNGPLSTLALLSIIAGVPLGAGYNFLSHNMKEEEVEHKELRGQIDEYHDANDDLSYARAAAE